jgi:hypothetical protein
LPALSVQRCQAYSGVGMTSKDAVHAAAALLGRLGGSKGGKARAKSLSKKRRREIARIAANARWKKNSHCRTDQERENAR